MTFLDWLEENRETLLSLLRNDTEDALYQAWIAGYQAGGDALAKTVSVYYNIDK